MDFRFENDGNHHRFGLRAVPPAALATPLDVRGDFTGRTVTALAQWNGQVFAQLEYTDIAAWRAWVPFPVYFPHGVGAVRAWVGLKDGEVAQITADVQLAQVRHRLGRRIAGPRSRGAQRPRGLEACSRTATRVARLRGLACPTLEHNLQPTDSCMRYHRASGKRAPHGELQANALDVEPLIALADHLPFEAEVRKEFEAYAPRGSFYDVAVKWTGHWPRPEAEYGVKAGSSIWVSMRWPAAGARGMSGSNRRTELAGR